MNLKFQSVVDNYWYWILFLLCTIVYIGGLLFPIYGVDANQYASMSREIMETGEYLQLKHMGGDYLDKPPLLFWITSLFFKIFGLSPIVYKLPSFLFSLVGVYSTYKLGKLLYNENIGKLSALILYSCQGFFLLNHDIRTDTILVSIIIFTVWKLIDYIITSSKLSFLLCFFGMALGMLTKGPIIIIVVGSALIGQAFYSKNWRLILRWEWLVGIVITFLVLAPFLWGLYQQWDMHPEKELYPGVKRISGIRFFLWDQSFGRIFGSNPFIEQSGEKSYDYSYFIHTTIWAFLPWTVLAIGGVGHSIKSYLRNKKTEFFTLGAFVLPFIAVSLSSYKLPYYVFVTYPFLAIMSAVFIVKVKAHTKFLNKLKWIVISFYFLLIISFLVINLLVFYSFDTNWFIWMISMVLLIFSFYFLSKKENLYINRILVSGVFLISSLNIVANFFFYPLMANYSLGHLTQKQTQKFNVYALNTFPTAVELYSNERVKRKEELKFEEKDTAIIISYPKEEEYIRKNYNVVKIDSLLITSPTRISLDFFIPEKRIKKLKKRYIYYLKKPFLNKEENLK